MEAGSRGAPGHDAAEQALQESPLLGAQPTPPNTDPADFTVEQAVTQMGFGLFQRRMVALCGFGLMMDVLLLNMMAFLLPRLSHEWGLSKTEQGLLGSATYVGMVFGAYYWGHFADRRGRKAGFVWTLLVASAAGITSAFSHTILFLAACRVVVGFGVGGNAPLAFTLFSELIPVKDRGFHMILMDVFAPLGMLLSCGLASVFLSRWHHALGWRAFALASSLPGLLTLVNQAWMVESPRFYSLMGLQKETKHILYKIALTNHASVPRGTVAVEQHPQKAPLRDLFHNRQYTVTTLLLWLCWVGLNLGSTGIHIWLPTFFKEKGVWEDQVPRVVLFTAFGEIPGLIFAAALIDRIGRIWSLALVHTLAGLFALLFAFTVDLDYSFVHAFFLNFAIRGAHSLIFVYTSEVYPTSIRASGLGLAASIARVTGMISPILGGILLLHSLEAPLLVYSAAFLVGGLASLGLPIETSGRVLEEKVGSAANEGERERVLYPALYGHVSQ